MRGFNPSWVEFPGNGCLQSCCVLLMTGRHAKTLDTLRVVCPNSILNSIWALEHVALHGAKTSDIELSISSQYLKYISDSGVR